MNKLMKQKILRTGAKCPAVAFLILAFLTSIAVQPTYGQDQIVWYSMQKAQQLAQKNNKKVLIYAGADWCVYCQKMDEQVFPQQEVIDSLQAYFYGVRVDIESSRSMVFNGKKMTQFKFARKHRVRATPTFIFLNSEGRVMGAQPGFIPAETFSRLLGYIGSGAFKQMEFGIYLSKIKQ